MRNLEIEYCEARDGMIDDIINNELRGVRIFTKKQADRKEDMEGAVDYHVTASCGEMSVRIRSSGYWKAFGDITFRSDVPSSNKTELDKLIEGKGEFYLYIWEAKKGEWKHFLYFDLDKLREKEFFRYLKKTEMKRKRQNNDGTALIGAEIEEIYRFDGIVETDLNLVELGIVVVSGKQKDLGDYW